MALSMDAIRGRVLDVDSHEMIPPPLWGQAFGERGQRFLVSAMEMMQAAEERRQERGDAEQLEAESSARVVLEDHLGISSDTVWEIKTYEAPSAVDFSRRVAVLDEMGIDRALVFTGMGILAWVNAHGGGFAGLPLASPDSMKAARDALDAYNEWAIANATDRVRIAGVLDANRPGMTPDEMVKVATKLIKGGLRVLHIGTGEPPAGLGPADPALDKFYATLAEANVALVTHPPAGMNLVSEAWRKAGGELGFEAMVNMGEENFVAQMVLGGVFERHPKLRFGCIECGASWIGPLAERLDVRLDSKVAGGVKWSLPLKPSEYINRNVRVSVLMHEPVERWLVRHPEVQDTYCYSSDFPHPEGCAWSLKNFHERVAPLGDEIARKFFFENAELLLPA